MAHQRYRNPTKQFRHDRLAAELWVLGERALAEFLSELADRIGGAPAIEQLLTEYTDRLSPEMLRATGGDRFPPQPLRAVPVDARDVA